MKKIIVFIGNYGSGKTELAINFAVKAANSGEKTMLIDLDIVNPYFRSAEQTALLQSYGIKVISPPYACSNVDMPVVPAETATAFTEAYDTVIFDVGGDAVGATALGQYHTQFAKTTSSVLTYFVVNTKRPLSATASAVKSLLRQIQDASRLKISGMINNTNLAAETTIQDVAEGDAILKEVSLDENIPIVYTTIIDKILPQLKTWNHHLKIQAQKISGKYLPITIYMRPNWLD